MVPGGTDYVAKLVAGCTLSPAETLLEVGVGMGGCSKAIIEKYGNYIIGYEADENLGDSARLFSTVHKFQDRLEVINERYEAILPKSGYFRAALLRDVLYTVEDKEALLRRVIGSLKRGVSYLIMTDFLFDQDDMSPELKAWVESEECPVYPWTEAALTKCLKLVGLTPRVILDDSEDYQSLVNQAWGDYLKRLQEERTSDGMRVVVAREAERWTLLVAALQNGSLHHYRIECVKTS